MAKKKPHKLLHTAVSLIAVVSPLMTFPQAYEIYSSKNASGVSVLTWAAYVGTSLIWLTYGIAHKDKPIIINSTIGGILSFLVAIGAMIY